MAITRLGLGGVARAYGAFQAKTQQTIPPFFDDLTTLFCYYMDALRDANPLKVDTVTLITKDRPTVIAGSHSPDDLNTALAEYLTPLF